MILELGLLSHRPTPHASFQAWAKALRRDSLYMSVHTWLELEARVQDLARHPKTKAQSLRLAQWMQGQLKPLFEGRLLALDERVLTMKQALGLDESPLHLLAATALAHGLILVSRQAQGLKAYRLKTLDPWRSSDQALPNETKATEAAYSDWGQASQSGPVWLRSLFLRS